MTNSVPPAGVDEVATLRRLIELDLDNTDLRIKLIERLTGLGNDGEVVEEFLIAVNAAPARSNELAALIGVALQRAESNLQLEGFFGRQMTRAEQLVEAGDYDRAIFYYRIAYAQQAFRWPLTQLLQRRNPAAIATLFHQYHYYSLAWMKNRWMGVPIQKNPFDLWIMQEILHEVQPDILIETGTFLGGSALYYAHLFDTIGKGRVVSIDKQLPRRLPRHPRISYIEGSSVDAGTVTRVRDFAGVDGRCLVVLDSLHYENHVRQELGLWSPLVARGSYLIVEDTNLGGNPVWRSHGPGPRGAIEEFLGENPDFVRDDARERHLYSWNAGGFLRRF